MTPPALLDAANVEGGLCVGHLAPPNTPILQSSRVLGGDLRNSQNFSDHPLVIFFVRSEPKSKLFNFISYGRNLHEVDAKPSLAFLQPWLSPDSLLEI